MYVDSDEFKDLNLSNDDYLERLYKIFMNRPSDEGGKAYWLERLESGFTRDYVYLSFAMCPEFTEICDKCGIRRGEIDDIDKLQIASNAYVNQNINVSKYVTRCYTKILGRSADAEGLEYWCKQILTEAIEPKTVAESYVLSNEFVNKNTTNSEYIEILYQTFFDRTGDEGGTSYWLGQLSSGAMTRLDVLHSFSALNEFAEILEGITNADTPGSNNTDEKTKPLGYILCECGYIMPVYTYGLSDEEWDTWYVHEDEHDAKGESVRHTTVEYSEYMEKLYEDYINGR